MLNSEFSSLHALVTRLAIGTIAMACIGCGGQGVVPIETKFSLDGEPLKDASVTFIRSGSEQGRASFGMTDEDGIAKLTTYEPLDGVLPGNYVVVVVKSPEDAMTFEEVEIDPNDIQSLVKLSATPSGSPRRQQRRVRTVIPRIYGNLSTTPLKCEVTNDSTEFEFELSSDN